MARPGDKLADYEVECQFWRQRASRLRNALLAIADGAADPAKVASDAIEYERSARDRVEAF
jgi:hypothetical protein